MQDRFFNVAWQYGEMYSMAVACAEMDARREFDDYSDEQKETFGEPIFDESRVAHHMTAMMDLAEMVFHPSNDMNND